MKYNTRLFNLAFFGVWVSSLIGWFPLDYYHGRGSGPDFPSFFALELILIIYSIKILVINILCLEKWSNKQRSQLWNRNTLARKRIALDPISSRDSSETFRAPFSVSLELRYSQTGEATIFWGFRKSWGFPSNSSCVGRQYSHIKLPRHLARGTYEYLSWLTITTLGQSVEVKVSDK